MLRHVTQLSIHQLKKEAILGLFIATFIFSYQKLKACIATQFRSLKLYSVDCEVNGKFGR